MATDDDNFRRGAGVRKDGEKEILASVVPKLFSTDMNSQSAELWTMTSIRTGKIWCGILKSLKIVTMITLTTATMNPMPSALKERQCTEGKTVGVKTYFI